MQEVSSPRISKACNRRFCDCFESDRRQRRSSKSLALWYVATLLWLLFFQLYFLFSNSNMQSPCQILIYFPWRREFYKTTQWPAWGRILSWLHKKRERKTQNEMVQDCKIIKKGLPSIKNSFVNYSRVYQTNKTDVNVGKL